ncbi:MAG TPA: hypothetical protein VFR09_00415, partial [Alphaproteobacteria bacterium]|nr:hypothetical protein [Alphaproteobacteria bacterium]
MSTLYLHRSDRQYLRLAFPAQADRMTVRTTENAQALTEMKFGRLKAPKAALEPVSSKLYTVKIDGKPHPLDEIECGILHVLTSSSHGAVAPGIFFNRSVASGVAEALAPGADDITRILQRLRGMRNPRSGIGIFREPGATEKTSKNGHTYLKAKLPKIVFPDDYLAVRQESIESKRNTAPQRPDPNPLNVKEKYEVTVNGRKYLMNFIQCSILENLSVHGWGIIDNIHRQLNAELLPEAAEHIFQR